MTSASLEGGPDIDDMLRSQDAARRSRLLESRIQASLLTIANWRQQDGDFDDDIGETTLPVSANDNDTGTRSTSPSTSCGSSDTLNKNGLTVVRFGPNGDEQELPLRSNLLPHFDEERRDDDADAGGAKNSKKQKPVNNANKLNSCNLYQKKELSEEGDPMDAIVVKRLNTNEIPKTPSKKHYTLSLFSPPESPPSHEKSRQRHSQKTRGDHIRRMKQYDGELLDSFRYGTPKPKFKKSKRRGRDDKVHVSSHDHIKRLTSHEEVECVAAGAPDEASHLYEENEQQKSQLRSKVAPIQDTRPRPPLERRVSQLMTMADDIKGETILFPRAPQRRSHSGRRESLITSTKKRHQQGDSSSRRSFWSNPFQSLRLRSKHSTTGVSSFKSWRPMSMRLVGKKTPTTKETLISKRSKSSRSAAVRKKASWDDVPDYSDFPPSFFGNVVVVSKSSDSSAL